MSKLIDEVVLRARCRYAGYNNGEWWNSLRIILNEMFEEREVWHQGASRDRDEMWWPEKDITVDCERTVFAQTILVPRAKPEPTLAEAAKAPDITAALRALDTLKWALMDNFPFIAGMALMRIRAALAPEEGKHGK